MIQHRDQDGQLDFKLVMETELILDKLSTRIYAFRRQPWEEVVAYEPDHFFQRNIPRDINALFTLPEQTWGDPNWEMDMVLHRDRMWKRLSSKDLRISGDIFTSTWGRTLRNDIANLATDAFEGKLSERIKRPVLVG